MKKRLLKAASVALCASMLFAASVPASAAVSNLSGSWGVDIGMNNPVYEVILPTSTVVSIDPFSIGMDGGKEGIQVASPEYKLTNNSDFPVYVGFSMDIALGDDVTLLEKDGFVYDPPAKGSIDFTQKLDEQNSMAATVTKDIFFGVVSPSTITYDGSATPVSDLYQDNALVVTYDTFSGGTMSKASVESVVSAVNGDTATDPSTLSFAFLLGKSTQAGNETSANTNADDDIVLYSDPAATADEARFKYYGQMNTYANWVGNELEIKGVYKINGIDEANFISTPIGSTMRHGFNMFAVSPFVAFVGGFVTTEAQFEAAIAAAAADFALEFNYNSGTVSSVVLDIDGTLTTLVAGAANDYVINATDITITSARMALIKAAYEDVGFTAGKKVVIKAVMATGDYSTVTATK